MTEEHSLRERLSRAGFIRLGAALAAGAAGASVLAACAGGEGGEGGGAAATTGATGNGQRQQAAQGGAGGAAIAAEADVPPGSAVQFADPTGAPAVLVHLKSGTAAAAAGGFAAYSAVCTHQGCAVAYQPQSGQLACPCHGSVFDPARGAAVVSGPAPTPLPKVPIRVQNGEVFRA